MASVYNFKEIEKKWQEQWEKVGYGRSIDGFKHKKHYHLVEFPYPSGAGLHVGHCMGYGASDAYCRMKRMQGYNVLFPIGWDAFGLPTENYAIKNKVKPQKATADNVAVFKKQMKMLGYSFDWDREVNTTDPDYYKWTQWIFLQFYKHAIVDGKLVKVADDDKIAPRLAFQAEMPVNWCPSCKIVLANEEVVAGNCERCGSKTEKRKQKQWMLRITAYADKLIKGLNEVDYLDKIKTQQINWIGKSVGTNIIFDVVSRSGSVKDEQIEVFTTRADTLFGCTYVVLSPEHPMVERLGHHIQNYDEVKKYVDDAKKKSDLERTELQKEKTGVKLYGVSAINPINDKEVDVYIADYVLSTYGTGAVMAVPAHDDRDWEFAKMYRINIKGVISAQNLGQLNITDYTQTGQPVVSGNIYAYHKGDDESEVLKRVNQDISLGKELFTGYGVLINSGDFSGLESSDAKKAITEKLKELGKGDFAVNFKLRDWIFSRQHYWGEPIPIIHCDKCGLVPVPDDQLPITLPEVENYEPTNTGESPLAKIDSWVNVKCPNCNGDSKRETDTMPNWAGSSWYFLRYTDPKNIEVFASKDNLKYWLPVDLYNGGMEHTTLHLLYSRFWHKFLYDLEAVPTSEPYQKRIAHGIILGSDGRKMSKSFGNVINPDDIAKQFGVDTLRAYIMFIGPYDQESAWSMAGVQGVFRFVKRLWNNFSEIEFKDDSKELLIKLNQTVAGVSDDLEDFRLNTVISKLMEFNNAFEKEGSISKDSLAIYLKLLFPIMPHLASELWEINISKKESIHSSVWPIADEKYLAAENIEVVVQINGKVRDRLTVPAEIADDKLKELALASPRVLEFTEGREIRKVIVVPNKLVSIVV